MAGRPTYRAALPKIMTTQLTADSFKDVKNLDLV